MARQLGCIAAVSSPPGPDIVRPGRTPEDAKPPPLTYGRATTGWMTAIFQSGARGSRFGLTSQSLTDLLRPSELQPIRPSATKARHKRSLAPDRRPDARRSTMRVQSGLDPIASRSQMFAHGPLVLLGFGLLRSDGRSSDPATPIARSHTQRMQPKAQPGATSNVLAPIGRAAAMAFPVAAVSGGEWP